MRSSSPHRPAVIHLGMAPSRSLIALLALVVLLLSGCKQDDDTEGVQPSRRWVEKTVAVVAPIGDATTRTRLERTAQWLLDNLHGAQAHDTLCIRLRLEWHDESAPDLASTLAGRDDVAAIVGPFSDNAVATFAAACQKTMKPLIAPTITSEEIIRRYAVKSTNGITVSEPFLWTLTESDVSLTETLMSSFAAFAQYRGYHDCVTYLFAPDNTYGQTFNYWGPFFAENYGINLIANEQYDSDQQLADLMEKARHDASEADSIMSGAFCVVDNLRQIYDVTRLRREQMCAESPVHPDDPDDPVNDQLWQLFTYGLDTFFAIPQLTEEELDALGPQGRSTLQGYQGFSPYADPTTGFELSYKQRFGVWPTFSECKFYDALMLTAFAACYAEHQKPSQAPAAAPDDGIDARTRNNLINNAIITITTGGADTMGGEAWSATAMEQYLMALERGQLRSFKGASGAITFDSESFTAATETTYVRWQILNGQIMHTGYIGGGGSRRVSNNLTAWSFFYDKNRAEHDFEEQTATFADISYRPLTDQYAVLVQGSHGFNNYRHMSDVLNVYQLLRQGGFPDDHIILVIDKAAAVEAGGSVCASVGGPDLYGGTSGLPAAVVDYDNSTLTPADIARILTGQAGEHTPVVLPRDGGQNVLLYWSGHGLSGEFSWRDAPHGHGFTHRLLQQTAQAMLGDGTDATCRKLFVVAEPCYAESVVRSLSGITGALAMSGAGSSEQSWADNWSNTLLVWLSDRFTQNFVTMLSPTTAQPATPTYRQLFLYCAEHTLGSHAKIVNAANFGNLSVTNPGEFIKYNK